MNALNKIHTPRKVKNPKARFSVAAITAKPAATPTETLINRWPGVNGCRSRSFRLEATSFSSAASL